ncbi:MAG: helix-turn-helix domain-containing protein [Bacilli bacterium]|nr:helix-turn-helix domain-containing protein [Bacilli bacterium]
MSKESIGPKIKRIRKNHGLTQEEFAESLGYSGRAVICHIEKGDVDMTYDKMLLLLRTYAVDANELFDVERIDRLLEDYRNTPFHKKVAVYIHGLHGSAQEAEDYAFLQGFDVRGLDYEDGNPYEMGEIIRSKFQKIIEPYQEVVVIANSIGAFYAYEFLSDFPIKQAFFISPVADMSQLIFNMMMFNRISKERLKAEKFVKLKDGTMLSYDFYQYLQTRKDNWKVPTEVLYGSDDELIYLENIADFISEHDARLTIKKGAGHYFHAKKEKAFIRKWILKNLHA